MKIHPRSYIGLLLLVILVILILVFQKFPEFCNAIYTNGLFVVFRTMYDFTLGNLPFPSIYLILPCLLFYLFYELFHSNKLGRWVAIRFLFNFFGVFIFCFYLLWGFNYYAPTLSSRMELQEVQLDKQYIIDQINVISPKIQTLRHSISQDTSLNFLAEKNLNFEDSIRKELEELISTYGYNINGKVRVKGLIEGVLLRFRTSGIYIPYVLEGHLDKGLHPLQWPFTMAHEMAHGYGVTDERECNFLAFVITTNISQKEVQYSGYVAYWRYLMGALKKVDREKFTQLYNEMDPLFLKDLQSIYAYVDRFPEWLPYARDKIYDNYLKAHGVNDGIISYGKMIEMIAAYNMKMK